MMRFEFYGARALNNQLDSSEKYKDLKPVYQIIFIEKCAWNNKNLINHYQMRNEQGEDESKHPLIRRTYIHLPVINEIAKKKASSRWMTLNSSASCLKTMRKMIYWNQRKGW